MTEEERRGRRALFSEPQPEGAPDPLDPGGLAAPGAGGGRRALFSSTEPPPVSGRRSEPRPTVKSGRTVESGPTVEPEAAGAATAVVHCRTCLAATPLSLPELGLSLIPSLWLPTRRWPRLMRCPACHRVSWCRIEWPRPMRVSRPRAS